MAEFEAVKAQMPEVVRRRCQFILEENQRVLDLAAPLAENDGHKLKEMFSASYFGARDLYEISTPAMEEMYRSMMNASGVVAARQAGAGFGGCMVALVRPEKVNQFSASVVNEYKQRTKVDAEIYAVQASAGASIIQN